MRKELIQKKTVQLLAEDAETTSPETFELLDFSLIQHPTLHDQLQVIDILPCSDNWMLVRLAYREMHNILQKRDEEFKSHNYTGTSHIRNERGCIVTGNPGMGKSGRHL